jgi:molybdate transport repressor ModE-like protein
MAIAPATTEGVVAMPDKRRVPQKVNAAGKPHTGEAASDGEFLVRTDRALARPVHEAGPAADAGAELPNERDVETIGSSVQLESIHPLRLRLLLAIERTGSISAAAEACSIGQPSASMHLRALEIATERQLVHRSPGGSNLTPAGKVVASHAVRVLTTLDNMLRKLNTKDGDELSLATSHTAAVAVVPPLLRHFSERLPGTRVNLRTLPSRTVVEEIARGEADIGIAGEVRIGDDVESRQILVDELVGIARSGSVTVEGGSVTLRELARNGLLLGPEGSSTRIAAERYLSRANYRPSRVWVFDSYEAIKRAVAEGLGVSFISRRLIGAEVRRRELTTFRVWGVERMIRPLYLVRSPVRELTTASQMLIKLLTERGTVSIGEEVRAEG